MIWGCFAASGSGRIGVTEGPVNFNKYQGQKITTSVCDLNLKRSLVIQHEDDPKHKSKSASECFKQKRCCI